jgi:hypothetical protein
LELFTLWALYRADDADAAFRGYVALFLRRIYLLFHLLLFYETAKQCDDLSLDLSTRVTWLTLRGFKLTLILPSGKRQAMGVLQEAFGAWWDNVGQFMYMRGERR